ncbi:hypothetical protein FRC03_008068 [Tulasnella sp. 419]|nr:hypothetical protein FRC03_008068 [Tulasnella sp. 419]
MSTRKSIRSLGSVLSKAPKVLQPKKLRRYSWLPDVLTIEGSVVPLLSVVVGLILVFRNGTSYDRYYEGRRDFGVLTSHARNIARNTWIQVNVPPGPPSNQVSSNQGGISGLSSFLKPAPSQTEVQITEAARLRREKIRFMRLVISFCYAVMHHLRDEPGTDYEDYKSVLPDGFEHFVSVLGVDRTTMSNRFRTHAPLGEDAPTTPAAENGRPNHSTRIRVQSGHAAPTENTALLSDDHTTVEFHPYSTSASMPLPLIIAHEMTRMLYRWKLRGYIDPVGPAGLNAVTTTISAMVEQLTHMERVATTPIPISYGIHLKQCVSLYLFTLPFTLINDMKWRMVPVVTVVAFTLMGIEGIANEIEMPFGKDKSDLPLHKFCAAIRSEIEYIMERLPEGMDDDVDPFANVDVAGIR